MSGEGQSAQKRGMKEGKLMGSGKRTGNTEKCDGHPEMPTVPADTVVSRDAF
jgi:hypothetical protein